MPSMTEVNGSVEKARLLCSAGVSKPNSVGLRVSVFVQSAESYANVWKFPSALSASVQPPPSVVMSQYTEKGDQPPEPSGSIRYVPSVAEGSAVLIDLQLSGTVE